MASKELEIKFKLSDKDFGIVSKWLSENAQFIADENHEEYYFDNGKAPFSFINEEGFKDADDYLRLRKEKSGKYSICLKKWHKHPTEKNRHTHCDEYEFEVSDFEKAIELLKNIGFGGITPIIKSRKKYMYKTFEIVIDEVKGLGRFSEIELKEDFGDPEKAFEKIYKLLKEIGINKIEQQSRGYVSFMWNPDYDFTFIKNL